MAGKNSDTPGTKGPAPANDAALKASAAEHESRAANLGRIVALLLVSPRHVKLTVQDLNYYLVPALALGQFVIVGAKDQSEGPTKIAAAVWWAFVSPEVDQRLSDSRDDFLKLEPGDWNSGSVPWIIEAIGENRVVKEVLKNIGQRTFKGATAKLRAVLPDGRIAVGRMEPVAPGAPTKA